MMRRILEGRRARRRRARAVTDEPQRLSAQCFERLYPRGAGTLRRVHQRRIPAHAPDWYFEAELRRSGLLEMTERCYPTQQAQSQ